MRSLARIWLAVAVGFCVQNAVARELSLADVLKAAEENSPRLKESFLKELAAHEGVGAAQAAYYPSLAGEAVDSWGFPGSSGALGIGGLMGSPYRSGAAAGVVAQDTLFDFGRTYTTVKSSKYAEQTQHEEGAVDRYAVDQDILQTFYECSRFRSEHEVWDSIHGEIELVTKEVVRFVNTGQRSVVDRYLSQAQVEEARTNRNFFHSRMDSTVGRLALLMGSHEQDLSCPALPSLDQSVPLSPTGAVNPYVLKARTEIDLAQNRLFGAKTEYLPKIIGVASAGGMEKVRLVDRTDYSGALGVIVPLFDGLGTVHRVKQARAELDAKRQGLAAVQLKMDELNSRYDEIINASQARIEHLEREEKLAQEGFSVAKNRYFKFQGTLVDLRDALRNLGRIETEMKDTQANLLEAVGAKMLLNGGVATGYEINERKP